MHSQNEIQLNLRVPLKLFNTITMPKDKEVKAKKNANYMLMFRKIMFRAITIIIQTLLLGTSCDIMIISHLVGRCYTTYNCNIFSIVISFGVPQIYG